MDTTDGSSSRPDRTTLLSKLGWLVVYWIAGVASMTLVALVLKLLLQGVGLKQ